MRQSRAFQCEFIRLHVLWEMMGYVHFMFSFNKLALEIFADP